MQWELRSHQKEALDKLRNGSILCGGVGSGKSMVAAAYHQTHHKSADVYVITTARKRDSLDWRREFMRFGIGDTSETSVGGVLTVDSWNNIGKYLDIKDALFVFDEQRLVGAGFWVKSFLKIVKSNHWILLSATPGDSWLDYIPVFLANGFYQNRTQFKAEHVIYRPNRKYPQVDRFVNEGKLRAYRAQIVVDMPYERHTTRHTIEIPVEYDRIKTKALMKTRWNPITEEPMRNAAELYGLLRRVVSEDPSRLEALKRVLVKHRRLIVFYNFDYELEILRGLSSLEGFELAEWNGHKHQEVPESEAWLYLVQYSAGAEAWECTATNAMFFYSQTYSYKILEQAYGRIDRLNTLYQDLYYYVPMSSAMIDRAIRSALKAKRDFQESRLSGFN